MPTAATPKARKKTLKVLCVRGLGDTRGSTWQQDWQEKLLEQFPEQDKVKLDIRCSMAYQDVFHPGELTFAEMKAAIGKLLRSAWNNRPKRRGILSDARDTLAYTAGYVVAWLSNEEFQQQSRAAILQEIREFRPDVILCHSLGTLVTYNAITHPDAADKPMQRILNDLVYITFGSQLGNPFVKGNLTAGRLQALPVRHWFHLYNKHDDIFTAKINLPQAHNFSQIKTTFNIKRDLADHDALAYLDHARVVSDVFQPVVEYHLNVDELQRSVGFSIAATKTELKARAKAAKRKPNKRALLIGINDYPDPNDRLEGCVNDVYQMSSVLQECGFQAEEIRVCLNERATADGIIKRLKWLLEDPQSDDERVLYFSGHGAQIPEYGTNNEPDRLTETLVPWDFNWTDETCITDERICELYSQLPYDIRFVMVLDCCHSGGLTRDGGATAKGLTAPDDIRHRAIRWDQSLGMWVGRELPQLNKPFAADKTARQRFFGKNEATMRMGRAAPLRLESETQYEQRKKLADSEPSAELNLGPYLPLIVTACSEGQFAYEYRHGVTSYGAFTFALSQQLRKTQKLTFNQLIEQTYSVLYEQLQFEQQPEIEGPAQIKSALVPWQPV